MNNKSLQIVVLSLLFSLAVILPLRRLLNIAFEPSVRVSEKGGRAADDFNGDGASDIVLRDESFHVTVVGSGGLEGPAGGAAKTAVNLLLAPPLTGIPMSGNFNGDSLADVANFIPQTAPNLDQPANWEIWLSDPRRAAQGNISPLVPTPLRFSWGLASAKAIAADYDGDGSTDLAVFDSRTADWNIAFMIAEPNLAKAAVGLSGFGIHVQWGLPGDIPLPADYDGDKKADFAVVRTEAPGSERQLRWLIKEQNKESKIELVLGRPGDVPLAADFDGDGKSEPAVYRAAASAGESGTWLIGFDLAARIQELHWCEPGAEPFTGDYDGDGRADLGCFYPGQDAHWKIQLSRLSPQGRELFGDKGPGIFVGTAPKGATHLQAALLRAHQNP